LETLQKLHELCVAELAYPKSTILQTIGRRLGSISLVSSSINDQNHLNRLYESLFGGGINVSLMDGWRSPSDSRGRATRPQMPELRVLTKEKRTQLSDTPNEDEDSDEVSVSDFSASSLSSTSSSDRPEESVDSEDQEVERVREESVASDLEAADWPKLRQDGKRIINSLYAAKVECAHSKVLETLSSKRNLARKGWWPIQPQEHARLWTDGLASVTAEADLRHMLSLKVEEMVKREVRRLEQGRNYKANIRKTPNDKKKKADRSTNKKRKSKFKSIEKEALDKTMDQLTQELELLCVNAMERRRHIDNPALSKNSRHVWSARRALGIGHHMNHRSYDKARKLMTSFRTCKASNAPASRASESFDSA
jgi:hypothetical protein